MFKFENNNVLYFVPDNSVQTFYCCYDKILHFRFFYYKNLYQEMLILIHYLFLYYRVERKGNFAVAIFLFWLLLFLSGFIEWCLNNNLMISCIILIMK